MSNQKKTVTVTIPRDGIAIGKRKVQFATQGFAGAGCQAATEAFERALGKTSVNEEFTAEFSETEERVEFLKDG